MPEQQSTPEPKKSEMTQEVMVGGKNIRDLSDKDLREMAFNDLLDPANFNGARSMPFEMARETLKEIVQESGREGLIKFIQGQARTREELAKAGIFSNRK